VRAIAPRRAVPVSGGEVTRAAPRRGRTAPSPRRAEGEADPIAGLNDAKRVVHFRRPVQFRVTATGRR